MKFALRSAKYFLALCVLCAAVMALNRLSGFAALTTRETLYVMFHTPRGMLLPAMIVLLALLYPRFGFVVRTTEGDLGKDREQLLAAFLAAGFSLREERDGELVFRAEGFLRRLSLLWEDEIRVTQQGPQLRIEGIRRGVARALYRLDSYLMMKRRNEE